LIRASAFFILKNPIIPEVDKTKDTIVPKGVCLFAPCASNSPTNE
jgi:hypothetical protein